MKLDVLPAGFEDFPLLRLYDFTPGEAERLFAAATQLAAGGGEVEVDMLPFVETLGDCKLALRVTGWDQGITQDKKSREFICGFTTGTWDNVAGLIEPFTSGASGFQWLAGSPGQAALLLSVSGDW